MDGEQKRIYMWCFPRSLSSPFLRSMMSRDSCKGVFEPWLPAFYLSSERVSDRFTGVPDRDGASFTEAKAMLEGSFKGYKEVFVKEHAYRMSELLETGTLEAKLARGYTHTFLIRHPKKYITSIHHGTTEGFAGFCGFRPSEASFQECYEMHQFVTEKLKQKSVIIDADDLQRDPETTLKLYCEAVGIDFQDSMLHWRPLEEEGRKMFEEWLPWTELAVNSDEFLAKTPSEFQDVSELPKDVQKAIEDAIPYYKKMYTQRLKPNN